MQVELMDYIIDYYRRRQGLGEHGDLATDIPATATIPTRRTLAKFFSITQSGLQRLKKILD